jgi:hypothetical protein
MLRRKKNFIVTILLVFVLGIILSSLPLYAQPPGGGTDPCPGGPPCNPDVPITGIEYLVIGGMVMGAKSLISRLKLKKSEVVD